MKRALVFIGGLAVTLLAAPIAFISEVSINGCCGAPSTGNEGAGFVVGGIVAVIGIAIMVYSGKLSK